MTSILKIPYTFLRPLYEKTSLHNGVISEISDAELRMAYAHCRSITRTHAKTFYMATRFLPYHKQRSIFAIYGLCRYLDDLVDEAEDLVFQKRISQVEVFERLELFKEKLMNTYRGIEHDDPILVAFADVLNRYEISIELPLLLLEGVSTDLFKNRYENFEELYGYSYMVASVVGLMTSEVFGYTDPRALDHAIDLGIAMQLTNILRDVGEDLRRDRIYIPADELKRFNLSEDNLFTYEISDNFVDLMKFQIERARGYYMSAEKGIPLLNRDSRLPVMLARENYSRILSKIEENQYQVFSRRAYLNSSEKLSILPRVIFQLR